MLFKPTFRWDYFSDSAWPLNPWFWVAADACG
jgi:hypothetical protein